MPLDDVARQYEDDPAKLLRLLTSDPAALLEVAGRKALTVFRPFPDLPAERTFNDVRFRLDFDFTLVDTDETDGFRNNLVKEMYYGSYRLLLVKTVQKHLGPGGVFLDIGANVGYISALAAGLVGRSGEVHAFEPIPQYASSIQTLADLNPEHTIVVNRCAVGETAGEASIAVDTTVFSGSSLAVDSVEGNRITVPVVRIDDYIVEKNLTEISLLFIEVEGYELPVLKGMRRYLDTGRRPPIITGMYPYFYPVDGYTLDDLAAFMHSYGYVAHLLSRPGVAIDVRGLDAHTLVLFTSRPA